MSVEDEKKPRKAPAKKKTSAASTADASATAKVKAAAAPKSAAPKKKAPAKKVSEVSASAPDGKAAASKPRPTNAEIAERAHGYFVARGRRHGSHEEDWLRAERELTEDL
jgi:hypothetical protein